MSAKLAKANGRFSETEIDDEIVVMSLESGDFFSLTGTARAVWQMIDGTRDRDGVLLALAEQFEVQPQDIAADIDAFVSQLQIAGLVESA